MRPRYLIAIVLLALPAPWECEHTTRPSTRPALLPLPGAPTLSEQMGQLDALTLRFHQRKGEYLESWDVVITDRELLGRFEAMRRSESSGRVVLYIASHNATIRFGETRSTARLGIVKLIDTPYALDVHSPNGRTLFIQTGEAGSELDALVNAEALRQRPEEPMIERPS